MEFGKEYFITSYSQLSDYLKFVINDDKDKQIKYIFTNGSNSKDGKMLDVDIFIVFDNDAILKIDYKFYGLMYIEYTWIQDLSLNDKEYNNENYYLNLNVSNARIESFEIERFVGKYEINSSLGIVRPDNGDYFKKITFKLSNGNNLCICAENAEEDGYCDIWTEDNTEKIEENMFNDDKMSNADRIRKWPFANLNNEERKYNFSSWDVPIIQKPEELMTKLKELEVKGRKIKAIKCIGLCYNLSEDNIEDVAYEYYKENGSEDFERKLDYKNIPLDTPYIRYVEIDEPIIIYLDNGDRLEIDYSEASSLKIGKNTLPKDLQFGINPPNADVNIIFSNCLEKSIIGYKIETSDELYDDFTGSHGISMPVNQKSYISNFKIYLEDNLYIEFSSFYDYGEVEIYEGSNNSTIIWKDLKKGIKDIE